MTYAIVTGWSAVIVVATYGLLAVLAVWDYRRSCRNLDERFEDEASSESFDYRKALRVSDRTRRGPEVEAHFGKTRIGRDRNAA